MVLCIKLTPLNFLTLSNEPSESRKKIELLERKTSMFTRVTEIKHLSIVLTIEIPGNTHLKTFYVSKY